MRREAPELVIFDCDGVLVDSEGLSNAVMAEEITALGWPLTTDDCLDRFKGTHFDEIIAAVENRIGRPVPQDWLLELRVRTNELFRRDLQAVPGVHEVIDHLEECEVSYCVASQGPLEKMAVTLEITQLKPRFEGRIFSAYEVERGKPHPDLFLHAAKSLDRDPRCCVVVEDSALGVQAARAAGMSVFGYDPRGGGTALVRDGARVFSAMRELPALLGL